MGIVVRPIFSRPTPVGVEMRVCEKFFTFKDKLREIFRDMDE